MNRSLRFRSQELPKSGQALAEFAVVLPVFLLVVFGLFDIGRLVFVNSTLSLAAREGARLGAAEAAWIGLSGPACVDDESLIGAGRPGAHVCPTDVAAFRDHVVDAVNRVAFGQVAVSGIYLSCNAGDGADPAPSGEWTDAPDGVGNGCQDGSGNPISSSEGLISVRVEHTYQPITPIINSLIPPLTLSGSATMVVH